MHPLAMCIGVRIQGELFCNPSLLLLIGGQYPRYMGILRLFWGPYSSFMLGAAWHWVYLLGMENIIEAIKFLWVAGASLNS